MKKIIPSQTAIKDLHQFIVGAIAPRPIAFVSTMDANGVANLAPYSFFNAFSSNPPILVFSSNRRVQDNTTKDTLHNAEATREVVVNVVNYDIVKQMTIASVNYDADISEFEKSGLSPLPSETVKPFRVKESPVHFECKVKEIITMGEHGGAGHLIICEVQLIHINENVIDANNRIDPNKLDLVGRLGRAYYVRASGDALFSLFQEPEQMAMGFDKLPQSFKESDILTGNDLASLASLLHFPSEEILLTWKNNEELQNLIAQNKKDQIHLWAKQLISASKAMDAFSVLLLWHQSL